MSFLDITIFSFIQGMSEFLPISSSGHLLILHNFIGLKEASSLSFDVALHLGTVLAILLFFIKDINIILRDALGFMLVKTKQPKLFFPIICSTIPAVIFGFIIVIFDLIDSLRILPLVAFNLIFFGILLYYVDIKAKNNTDFYQISNKKGFIIGLGQALSLIPGVSRSGICITTARLLCINKVAAIKYSMIISIPSILGAALLTFIKADALNFSYYEFFLGIMLSFIFGLIVIKLLMEFIKKFTFKLFMLYRIILGIIILLYYYW